MTRTRGVVARVLLFSFLALVSVVIVAVSIGYSYFGRVKEMTEMHYRSHTDTFRVSLLEVRSEPGYFTERMRIRCENDMDAGIWVTELKEAGLFEVEGPGGQKLYREGHPHKAGQSRPVPASGGFSTCEVLFTVRTTTTNTIWQSRISAAAANALGKSEESGGVDTTLPKPMSVSEIQTNWAGAYERGAGLPLANLGEYKILLIVK